MKNMLAPLLAGLLFCMAPFARAQSAEEMASNCKGVAEARIVESGVVLPQNFPSGVCWGSFGALQTATTVVPKSFPKDPPVLGVCGPEDTTRSQLVKIFMAYTARHPEELHKDYFFVALAALREVFPCPK